MYYRNDGWRKAPVFGLIFNYLWANSVDHKLIFFWVFPLFNFMQIVSFA